VYVQNVPKFHLRGCGTAQKTKSNKKNRSSKIRDFEICRVRKKEIDKRINVDDIRKTQKQKKIQKFAAFTSGVEVS
jgi:hypothetical protein